jgi:copper chaperone CopZ
MKKNIFLFSIVNVLAIFAVVGFTTSRGIAQTTKADPPAHSIVLHVNGMMCHDCEQKVDKALEKVKGVRNPKANYEKGTVTLQTVGKVAPQKLIAAVKTAGFAATVDNPVKPQLKD